MNASSSIVIITNIHAGIDYTHPVLGGGFGPGHKVIGGYDLVGDAYNGEFVFSITSRWHSYKVGTNTPMPDPDPLDKCAGEWWTNILPV